MRIDKWLWAARFAKTRQLSSKMVKTGKIKINQQRISKPAANVKEGDEVSIQRGPIAVQVIVSELSEQRGPAKVAQTLYQETKASIEAREAMRERFANQPKIVIEQRKPDKRGVRQHRALKRGKE